MNLILEGLLKAFWLIVSFDREVYEIMFLSLRVSGVAVLIGALLGVPSGATVGLKDFLGKRFLVSTVNTFMGLPPVVVGLLVYLLLSTSGPLGVFQLLYTPEAMIIAQLIMVIPIVMGVTISSCLLYTSPSPRDRTRSRMPSSA